MVPCHLLQAHSGTRLLTEPEPSLIHGSVCVCACVFVCLNNRRPTSLSSATRMVRGTRDSHKCHRITWSTSLRLEAAGMELASVVPPFDSDSGSAVLKNAKVSPDESKCRSEDIIYILLA